MTALTMRDEKQIEIIERVFRGELTVLGAALILGISERQCLSHQTTGSSAKTQGGNLTEPRATLQAQDEGDNGKAIGRSVYEGQQRYRAGDL